MCLGSNSLLIKFKESKPFKHITHEPQLIIQKISNFQLIESQAFVKINLKD